MGHLNVVMRPFRLLLPLACLAAATQPAAKVTMRQQTGDDGKFYWVIRYVNPADGKFTDPDIDKLEFSTADGDFTPADPDTTRKAQTWAIIKNDQIWIPIEYLDISGLKQVRIGKILGTVIP